jgi:hypothetical protein
MTGRQSWEASDEPESRDIFAAELVGDAGNDGQNPVASEIGNWIERGIERVRARIREWSGESPASAPSQGSVITGKATATAVGALEGTLKGKSLEGAFKEAQILEAFATARQRNAEAAKLEAEARKLTAEEEKLRQDAAFERLENVVALLERLGAPVGLAKLPGGDLAITVGETLLAPLTAVAEIAAGITPTQSAIDDRPSNASASSGDPTHLDRS